MRVAIITGAAGGIGRALVARFKSLGYRTVAMDRFASTDISSADSSIALDLHQYCRDPSTRAAADAELHAVIGEDKLAVLVNNAAVQILGPSECISTSDWDETLSVNLLAPFLLTQTLIRDLEAARGSVVNIASIHATLTKAGFVCYATSKAALVGLTRSMAVDLGGRVRVNAICPAAVSTPMLRVGFAGRAELLAEVAASHPVGRIAETEEIAAAAAYLASDEAGFLTGTVLAVDGGIGARLHDPV